MQGFHIRRPSPSMVVALIALVVALAGTAYAAVHVPKGSVGARQLKKASVTKKKIRKNAVTRAKIHKNAVTGIKIKNRSILGHDIRLKSVGKVPSAGVADTAYSLAPLEPLHLVGAAGEPAFEPGAGNVGLVTEGALSQPVGFYKDHDGIVHLEGFANPGKEEFVFRLPVGFRPASGITQIFLAPTGEVILIFGSNIVINGVDVSGKVLSEASPVVLSGLSFRPAS
jgi:hypothetical protein